MIVKLNSNYSTLVIELDAEETAIAKWIVETYGQTEFNMYLKRMFDSRRAQMHDEVKTEIWNHAIENPEMHAAHIKPVLHSIKNKRIEDAKKAKK